MDHDERVRLAGELAELLVERHGPAAIAAVGVHGSVARGDDTEESDLDLAVVTAGPEVEVPDRSLRYRGTVVDLGAIAADAYLEEASHIGPAWPLAADQYVNHLAVHDPGGFFHKLKHVHEAAVEEAAPEVFAAAAGFDLVQLLSWEAQARAAELAGDLGGRGGMQGVGGVAVGGAGEQADDQGGEHGRLLDRHLGG
ncbi:MAG: nucleotidyltransferase family protein, partial [Actinomycetota bacterium]